MLELFNIYFLVLVLIVSVLVGFIDARKFKKENRDKTAGKARLVGILYIVVASILFIANVTK